MDNADYLQHIAKQTKSAQKSGGGLLSPTMIKLIAGGIIAFILIMVLGAVINGANSKTTALYEGLYLRLQNFSADNGPLAKYSKSLKSSDIRAAAGSLKNSLYATHQSLSGALSELKIDPAELNEETIAEENAVIEDYEFSLHNAKLNGLLDRTYVNSTLLQITLIYSMESEILEKTDSETIKEILVRSMTDLAILHEKFTELSNNSK